MSACTKHLRLFGTVCFLSGMLVNFAETAYFGFNLRPQSELEVQWDEYTAVATGTGFLFLAAAWLRKKSEG